MIYSNFNTPIWYTLSSDKGDLSPARFLLQPIPYKIYSLLHINNPDHPFLNSSYDEILDYCIIGYENIIDYDGYSNFSSILPSDIKNELIRVLMDNFTPDREFLDRMDISLDVAINPRFSGESWDCNICQKKKLDYQRNCPLLPVEEHDPTYILKVKDKDFNTCPVIQVDHSLIRMAYEAKQIKDMGVLPEEGGIGNQTVFFVLSSQKTSAVVKYYEQKAQEEKVSSRNP